MKRFYLVLFLLIAPFYFKFNCIFDIDFYNQVYNYHYQEYNSIKGFVLINCDFIKYFNKLDVKSNLHIQYDIDLIQKELRFSYENTKYRVLYGFNKQDLYINYNSIIYFLKKYNEYVFLPIVISCYIFLSFSGYLLYYYENNCFINSRYLYLKQIKSYLNKIENTQEKVNFYDFILNDYKIRKNKLIFKERNYLIKINFLINNLKNKLNKNNESLKDNIYYHNYQILYDIALKLYLLHYLGMLDLDTYYMVLENPEQRNFDLYIKTYFDGNLSHTIKDKISVLDCYKLYIKNYSNNVFRYIRVNSKLITKNHFLKDGLSYFIFLFFFCDSYINIYYEKLIYKVKAIDLDTSSYINCNVVINRIKNKSNNYKVFISSLDNKYSFYCLENGSYNYYDIEDNIVLNDSNIVIYFRNKDKIKAYLK